MHLAMRTSFRWVLRLAVPTIVLIGLWFAAIAFPHPLFPHKHRADFCTIYSEEPFGPDLRREAEDAVRRLEGLEIHDPGIHREVFLCHSPARFSLVARLALQPVDLQGFNLSLVGNSYISVPRVDALRAASHGVPRYSIREGRIAHTIAHELVHEEMVDALGLRAVTRLPAWKTEGYAEYGANIRAIRADGSGLAARIAILDDDEPWRPIGDWARFCWESELLVEYLSEVEGYGFRDIMAEDVTREATRRAMRAWVARGAESAPAADLPGS